jgi:hypothetical protein
MVVQNSTLKARASGPTIDKCGSSGVAQVFGRFTPDASDQKGRQFNTGILVVDGECGQWRLGMKPFLDAVISDHR